MSNLDKSAMLRRALLAELIGTAPVSTGESIGAWVDKCIARIAATHLLGNERLRARVILNSGWMVISLFHTNRADLPTPMMLRLTSVSIEGINKPTVVEDYVACLRKAGRTEFTSTR